MSGAMSPSVVDCNLSGINSTPVGSVALTLLGEMSLHGMF